MGWKQRSTHSRFQQFKANGQLPSAGLFNQVGKVMFTKESSGWLGSTGYRDMKKRLLKSLTARAVVQSAANSHYTELPQLPLQFKSELSSHRSLQGHMKQPL
jgi:hypothetical protein